MEHPFVKQLKTGLMSDLNRRMGPPVKPLPGGHKLIGPPALNGNPKGFVSDNISICICKTPEAGL